MRIAIPLDENRQDVCVVLARAPYFLFQDDEEKSVVENPAAQTQGGAGIQAAQFLVDNDVSVLITVRCGQNAADVFAAAGIKIYKSVHKTAADELSAFAAGKLEELTQFHGGFQGTHGS
ncbi:MAG: NifB/NifX family molybdenum-iron cluster-binding protein [Lachnospiraceae bacterium]|nr:NifB/NifX family molybdenum-iron cluster-binding protein [Lachnospiraceae bacterium]